MAVETFEIKVDSSGSILTLDRIGRGLRDTGRAGIETSRGVDATNRSVRGLVRSLIGPLGAVGSIALVVRELNASIQQFRAYEVALVGVQKTTNLSNQELTQFSGSVRELSVELRGAAGTEELLNIAQAAGQLGVRGTENLLNFSRTVAQLNQTTDLVGTEGATALTRILTVTREGVGDIDIFASQIVALGNSFAATESEIVRVTTEVSRGVAVFGVSAGESAALAATLRSIGVQAELAGSAVGRSFRVIDSAVRRGGQALEDLSELTGLTGEEIRRTFQESSVEAFRVFVEGLGDVADRNGDVTAELARFGLRGEEILRVLPVLAQNSNLLGSALRTVAQEANNGGQAIDREFSAAINTLDASINNFSQRLADLRRTIGELFAGITEDSVNAATSVVTTIDTILQTITEGRERVRDLPELLLLGVREGILSPEQAERGIISAEDLTRLRELSSELERARESALGIAAGIIPQSVVDRGIALLEEQRSVNEANFQRDNTRFDRENNLLNKRIEVSRSTNQLARETTEIESRFLNDRRRQLDFELRLREQGRVGPGTSGFQPPSIGQPGLPTLSTDEITSAIEAAQFANLGNELLGALSLSFAPLLGQMIEILQIIANLPATITNAVNDILEAFASWEDILSRFEEELPQRLEAAFLGVGEALGRSFTQGLNQQTINIAEAVVTGFVDGLITVFGGSVDRNQTVGQTQQLEGLLSQIQDQSRAIERAGWTNSDWQNELSRLQDERDSLDRDQRDFWDEFIGISQSQFDTIKRLNTTQEEALTTLRGVLRTLDDTIAQLLGSTFNPDQTFASAQAAYDALLEEATAEGLTADERNQAVESLTNFVETFLERGQAQFGSSAAYQDLFAQVLEDLAFARTLVTGEADATEIDVADTAALLSELADSISNAIDESFSTTGQNVFNAILEVLNIIRNVVTSIIAPAIQTIQSLTDAILGGINAFVSIISNVLGVINSVRNLIDDIIDAINDLVPGGGGGGGFPNPFGFAQGGIASGPESGFAALLHGTEAVIPLQNGSVPVTLSGSGVGDDGRVSRLLAEQNVLLTSLIRTTRQGLQIDGRSFNDRVSMISDVVIQERVNRGLSSNAGLIL